MSEVTNEVIVERIDNMHKHNVEDHTIMKDGIAHTNGDVGDLKLWKAKASGAIMILAIVMTGIIIPLVLKYLSISLFK